MDKTKEIIKESKNRTPQEILGKVKEVLKNHQEVIEVDGSLIIEEGDRELITIISRNFSDNEYELVDYDYEETFEDYIFRHRLHEQHGIKVTLNKEGVQLVPVKFEKVK